MKFLIIPLLLAQILFFSLEALVSSGNFHLLPMKESEERLLQMSFANPFDEELVLSLSQNDYQYFSNGENEFPPANSLTRSNANWIQLPLRQLILKPREQRQIQVPIKIPSQVDLNGDYWSLVMVEPQTPGQQQEVLQGEFKLQVKVRYAVLIITRIKQGKANLRLLKSESQEDAVTNETHYIVDIINDGDIYLAPKVVLKVFDAQGALISDQESQRQRLLPSSSVRYMLPLPSIKNQNLQGVLILDGGQGHVYGEKIEIH